MSEQELSEQLRLVTQERDALAQGFGLQHFVDVRVAHTTKDLIEALRGCVAAWEQEGELSDIACEVAITRAKAVLTILEGKPHDL